MCISDLDLKDKKAYHLFCEIDGEIVAYLRILDKNVSYPEISIGRVLVTEMNRGKGFAREMMQRAISFIKDVLGEMQIRISAQLYLKSFYESLDFLVTSDVYLEDDIEHIEMVYKA